MAEHTGTRPLWHEITLALVLKGVLLGAIWYTWFYAPDGRSPGGQTVDESKMAAQLLSPDPHKEPEHGTVPGTR